MRFLPALCVLTVLPCLLAAHDVKAQGTWTSQDIFEPVNGYPFTSGPADDFGWSYAEYAAQGMHLASHYERSSASTITGISAMEANFSTKWTWNPGGPMLPVQIANSSSTNADLEKGTSVEDQVRIAASGAIASVNGITTCGSTTLGHTAVYQDPHQSLVVPETVSTDQQITSQTKIHTVACVFAASYQQSDATFGWQYAIVGIIIPPKK